MKRSLFIICALLFVSAGAFGQAVHQKTAQDASGHAIANALVKVCALSDTACSVASTIYSDNAGTVKANPFTADATGNYEFWANVGDYTVQVAKAGYATYTYHASVAPSMSGSNVFAGSNDFGGVYHCGTLSLASCLIGSLGTGKIIQLGPGTYNGPATITSNTVLQGTGPATVITIPNGTNLPPLTLSNNASNVRLRNFAVDGNGANQTIRTQGILTGIVTNLLIDTVEVRNTHDEGVWIAGGSTPGAAASQRVQIINSYIHDTGTLGLYVMGVAGLKMEGNTFRAWSQSNPANASALGFAGDNSTPVNYNTNVSLSGNHFYNTNGTRFAIESAAAAYARVVDGGSITGNVFDGNGLNASGISGYFFNTHFDNTHVNGGGSHRSGYEIEGTWDTIKGVIRNGTVAIAGNSGGDVSHITVGPMVIDNTTSTSTGDAACVLIGGQSGIPGPISYIDVDKVTCDLANATINAAVYVGWYGVSAQVNHITVSGLNAHGATGGSAIRLRGLTGSSDITVKNNTATGFASGWFDDGSSGNYTEVTVSNNDFRGNTTPVNTSFSAGASFRNDCNITVAGQTTLGCSVAPSGIVQASFAGELAIAFQGLIGSTGDNFNRADSATGLGTSASGQTWTNGLGIIGVLSKQAYLPSATNSKAFYNSGLSDGRFMAVFAALGTNTFLTYRYSDLNNHWAFGVVSGTYRVRKVVTGAVTLDQVVGGTPAVNDRLVAVAVGSAHTFYVNGVQVYQTTDSFNSTATNVGLWSADTTSRFAVIAAAKP